MAPFCIPTMWQEFDNLDTNYSKPMTFVGFVFALSNRRLDFSRYSRFDLVMNPQNSCIDLNKAPFHVVRGDTKCYRQIIPTSISTIAYAIIFFKLAVFTWTMQNFSLSRENIYPDTRSALEASRLSANSCNCIEFIPSLFSIAWRIQRLFTRPSSYPPWHLWHPSVKLWLAHGRVEL